VIAKSVIVNGVRPRALLHFGDLSSGTFDDAQVLKKFGDAPDDPYGL
jgi:hypothetical protein